jgi:hypothetical protein
MKMSNSPLVSYVHITKHKNSGRGGNKIEKIFVHHMAGNLTVRQCGSVFDNRQASAHYGVNGTAIGQYVDEKDTAWHCGNFKWNQRSIGIELANDAGSKGNWHVSDATIQTAIKLIADICRRNGIKRLSYTGNMNGNLCMHRWVCSTSCPGPYLSNQFARIALGVNKILMEGYKPEKLEVDGEIGPKSVFRMQEFLGSTMDGIISGQKKEYAKHYPAITAVDFDDTESICVKKLQWMIGVVEDGIIGPATVKAWQKFLKVSADGIFGPVSAKAWQKYLNEHDKAIFPATHVIEAPKPVAKPKTTSKVSSIGAKLVSKAKALAGSENSATKAYKNALNKAFPSRSKWGAAAKAGRSCDVFIATLLRTLGYDKDCPRGLRDMYTHTPPKDKFERIVHTNVKPKSVSRTYDIIIYKKKNGKDAPGHTCLRTATGIYQANNPSKYPHFTKGFSKLDTKRPVVIIWRPKG